MATVFIEDLKVEVMSLRQDVSKGRTPATQGPKNCLTGADMNISVNKNTEHNNKAVEERGVSSTKVYNLNTNLPTCSKTVDKNFDCAINCLCVSSPIISELLTTFASPIGIVLSFVNC